MVTVELYEDNHKRKGITKTSIVIVKKIVSFWPFLGSGKENKCCLFRLIIIEIVKIGTLAR